MPHPKNRLKLTGDTHLPGRGLEAELGGDIADEALVAEETRVYADGYSPQPDPMVVVVVPEAQVLGLVATPEPLAEHPGRVQALERTTGRMVSKKPWMAIAAGLLFGWTVMRVLRH